MRKLLRSNSKVINSFLSALGSNKEVYITGTIAYLINIQPEIANIIFKINEEIAEIKIENHDKENGRHDIYIVTASNKEHCIEAKIQLQNLDQINRYEKRFNFIHLISSSKANIDKSNKKIRTNTTWEEISSKLRIFKKSKKCNLEAKFIIENILNHLEETEMIRSEFKDVYIRDISGPTAELYFIDNLYFCQTKYFNSASKCRYFAPYLTKSNKTGPRANVFRILGDGLSYFSQIKDVKIVKIKEIEGILKEEGYTKDRIKSILASHDFKKYGRKEIIMFLLEDPIRLVHKPINKRFLLRGSTGAINATRDFGDIMLAANGEYKTKKAG